MTVFGKILAKCFGTQPREGHVNKPKDAANCCGHITGSEAEQCYADMAKLSEKRKSQGAHECQRVNKKKTLVHSNSVRSDIEKPVVQSSPSMTDATTTYNPSPSTNTSAGTSSEALCTPKGIYASDPPPILPISSRQSRMSFLSRNGSVSRTLSDQQELSSGKVTPPQAHAYKQRSVSAGVSTETSQRKPLQQALQDLSIKQTGLQRSQSVKVTKTENDVEKVVKIEEEFVDCDSLKCEKTPLSQQLDHENEQLRLSKQKAKKLHRSESSGLPPRQPGQVQGRAMRISNDDTRATMSMSSDSETQSIGYFTSFELQLTPTKPSAPSDL